MTKLYKNKYRIPSARLQTWDYGSNAAYFVTICTQEKICYFGNITNDQLYLSEMGKEAQHYWQLIPQYFPFVLLDAFIVMPNHVHGILVINKEEPDPTPAKHNNITKKTGGRTGKHNPMIQSNLSRIIRWYKGRCTFEIRKIHADFAWQTRFHEHIIRNDKSYQKIAEYIASNPYRWQEDKFYKKPT